MKKYILLFFTLLSFTPGREDQIIVWNENYKLTWNDYLGQPPANHPATAATTVTIDCYKERKGNEIIIITQALMNKSRSWILTDHKNNSDLLIHERLHFDIAELYARTIRQYALLRSGWYNDNAETNMVFDKYHKGVLLLSESENLRYDIETNHGMNKKIQLQWEADVAARLKNMEQYK